MLRSWEIFEQLWRAKVLDTLQAVLLSHSCSHLRWACLSSCQARLTRATHLCVTLGWCS